MPDPQHPSDRAAHLREYAEQVASNDTPQVPESLESLSPESVRQTLHELRVHQIELEMQNEELRRTQVELEASRARYFDLYDLAPVGYLTLNEPGLILEANLATAGLLGVPRANLVKQPLSRFVLPENQDVYYRFLAQLRATNEPQACELRMLRPDGTEFWARFEATTAQDTGSGSLSFRATMSDITERRLAESEREAALEILQLLNSTTDLHDLLREVTIFLQRWSGCGAVGIRLRRGEDYPYWETRGFPPEFVQAENQLCAADPKGELIRDSQGHPVIECMCGNVICGRFDPSKPFFTKHGSFWSNCTTKLLASTTEADRQARTRNRCNGEGYESVALIPLRCGPTTFGLLQLNDKREGRFSPDLIQLLERVADNLAVGLAQREAAEALKESERKARAILNATTAAVALLDRQGTVLDCNEEHALRLHLTRETLLGRCVFDLMPPDVAQRRKQVVEGVFRTGQVACLEDEREGMWNETTICPVRDAGGEVLMAVVHAANITERKNAEQAIRRSEEQLALAIEGSGVGLWDWMVQTGEATFNERWAEIVGYSLSELAPVSIDTWSKLAHPDDLARSNELLQRHFAGQSPAYECEARMKHKDGHWVWILDRGKITHRDAENRPIRMAGTHLDISDRKQAEEKLRQTVHRLELLATSAEELLRSEEPQRTVESLCRIVMAQLDSDLYLEYIADEAGSRLHLDGWAGISPEEARRAEWLNNGETICGCVARDGRRIVAEHIPTNPDPRTDRLRSWGIKAYACHPLLGLGGKVIGTLAFGMRNRETLSEDDLFLMKAVADQVATAMLRLTSQRSLRASEEQYRTIVESALEGIWQIDRAGRTTFANARIAEMLGTTVEEMAGQPFFDYMDDHRRAEAQALLERRLQGVREQHEFCFRRRDGSPLWALVSSTPICAEDGTAASALAMVTDITERKQAEESIRESESRFRQLAETIREVFWLGAPDWKEISYVSPAYEELWGRSCQSLYEHPRSWLEAVFPEDVPALLAGIASDGIGGAERIEFPDYRICRPDGSVRWISARAFPIRDEHGRVYRIAGIAEDITERKKAGEELREREERFRLALKATNDVVWDWDVVSDTQRWNEAGIAVFGWSDIVERPQSAAWWTERVHPDDRQRIHDSFFAVVENPAESHWRDEYRFRKSDGSYALVLDRGYVMRDERGRAVRMIGAMLDITERKRAEEALRESETRLRATAKAGNVGLWDWNVRTNSVYFSPEWKRQIGYEDHEISNDFSEWQSRVHPEDLDRALRTVQDFINKPWPNYSNEFRFRHKDGSYRWILTQASVLYGADSRPERMLGSHLDITDRKKAEDALRESEARFRELFSRMGNGVVVYEARDDGEVFVIKDINPAGARLSKVVRADIVGRSVVEVFPAVRDFGLFAVFQRVWKTGVPDRLPAAFYVDRRITQWVENEVYRLSSGEVVAIYEDITERKQAEKERAHLQEQLWQIQKLDSLGRMAAGIAHDFGNYLSVIRANAQSIMDMAALDGKGLDSLRMIRQAAEESLEITRSLLTFSRGSDSPAHIVNLRDAIQGSNTLLRHALPRSIRLEVEFGCERACRIQVEATQLHQALLNLALNARDAMPNGGFLRIATSSCMMPESAEEGPPVARSRGYARLVVSDTGEGMPPEVAARVFEPFFTTKARGKGSGLGLAIVHGLVESWGGWIEVQSQPGAGTTFTIMIPLAESEERGQGGTLPSATGTANGRTILLFGIEPYLRSFVAPTLLAHGYGIVSADTEDGLAGYLDGTATPVHLLILDTHFAGQGFPEYFRAISRRVSGTPAVILARKGHSLGHEFSENTVVLEEPYSLGDLVAAVSQLLDIHEGRETAP